MGRLGNLQRGCEIGGCARTRGDFVDSLFFFIFAPQLSQESTVVVNLSSCCYVSAVNKPHMYIIIIEELKNLKI